MIKKLKKKLEELRNEAVEQNQQLRKQEEEENCIKTAINLGKIETLTDILTEIIPEIEEGRKK